MLLLDRQLHRAARAVVLDGVLGQVEQHPIQQHIAAGELHIVACLRERDAVFLRQRRQIDQHFLGHRRKVDTVGARHRPQIAHLKQGAHKRTQALDLLLLKMQ